MTAVLMTLLLLLMSMYTPAHAEGGDNIAVTIDGIAVNFTDQQPQMVDGHALTPVREVFEALGFEMHLRTDVSYGIVELSRYDERVILLINMPGFNVQNALTTERPPLLEVRPHILGDSIMMPVRGVLEAMGYSVGWDDETRTILITSPSPNSPFETITHRGTRFTNVTSFNQSLEFDFHLSTPPAPLYIPEPHEFEIRWDLGATIHAYADVTVTYTLTFPVRGGYFYRIDDSGRLYDRTRLVHNRTFLQGTYFLLMNYLLPADYQAPLTLDRIVTIPIYLVATPPSRHIGVAQLQAPDFSLLYPNAPVRGSSNITIPDYRPMTQDELNAWINEYHANGGVSILELEAIWYTNHARVDLGLAPFEICPNLMMAARYKSQEMVDLSYFAHESPIHGHFINIPALFGTNTSGENLGTGGTPISIINRWLNSPRGHRLNMVSSSSRIGIGEYNGRWTLLIGR